MYKTNKIMKKYRKMVQKLGVALLYVCCIQTF